ncbi:MAG: Hsp20/alpha crystallin family protein [Gemmatimonadota bacterium]
MTMVTRRSPALSHIERRMQQLFEEPFRLPFIAEDMGWTPSVEVTETDSSIDVTAELPGVSKEDVDVDLENNVLTIRGEKKQQKQEKEKEHYLYERYYGSFQRSFSLPAPVDESSVKAEFRNGVLRIHLSKAAQSRGTKITITD